MPGCSSQHSQIPFLMFQNVFPITPNLSKGLMKHQLLFIMVILGLLMHFKLELYVLNVLPLNREPYTAKPKVMYKDLIENPKRSRKWTNLEFDIFYEHILKLIKKICIINISIVATIFDIFIASFFLILIITIIVIIIIIIINIFVCFWHNKGHYVHVHLKIDI